jgi:uncharacterized membrane protein (DUF2068 family)
MKKLRAQPRGLLVIAAFKLLKGLILLAIGIGAHTLLRREVVHEAQQWADLLRVDPHNHYLHRLLEKLPMVDEHRLKQLSIGTFFYSALFFAEGIGLAFRKRWAEYLTIVSTAGLLPLEIYEIVKGVNWEKIAVLIVNIVIVAYLVREVRRNKEVS